MTRPHAPGGGREDSPRRTDDVLTDPATPAELAALHAQCFPTRPRPWSADEFAALLSGRGVFLLPGPQSFLLGLAIAGEAELLTLAVAPPARRQGLARTLLTRFDRAARERGAETAFLEVACDNIPARALYRSAGWSDAGRRRDYYGPGTDALVMTRKLCQGH